MFRHTLGELPIYQTSLFVPTDSAAQAQSATQAPASGFFGSLSNLITQYYGARAAYAVATAPATPAAGGRPTAPASGTPDAQPDGGTLFPIVAGAAVALAIGLMLKKRR